VAIIYDGRSETRNSIINCLTDLPGEVFKGQGETRTLQSILSLGVKGGLALSILFLPQIISAPVAIIFSAPVVLDGVITLWTRGIKVEVLDASAVLFCLVRRDFFTAASIVFLL
jgi:Cu2+-exporting ATPase